MMYSYGYPPLHEKAGWTLGIHDVRHLAYEHPWLVVGIGWTVGAWTREEAREIWRPYVDARRSKVKAECEK